MDDEHLFGHWALEFRALRLEFLQAACAWLIHTSELVPPAEKSLLADVVALSEGHTCFGLMQDGNDLFFCKLLLHEFSLLLKG